MEKKRVYTFGNGKAEGKADMKNLLGGKGANLAEMNLIGVPVPPGFTITTDVCSEYYELGKDKVVELLTNEVTKAVGNVEQLMNSKFGDVANPLLVSVRSGARASMPGMMDTILNLGLNDEVVEGLAKKTGNERFAWDSYRRFVQMYGDVVLGMKPVNKEDIDPFEEIIEEMKHAKGVKMDNELDVNDLKQLVKNFKSAVKERTGRDFPTSAYEQLWGAVCAVFDSWMNERAILYRKMEGIPAEWGTAVTVQAMVFGNMGNTSATGVCFSRDAGSGEDVFNGEYLINAQGEDVVAGIRTPQQITLAGSRLWAEMAGVSEEDRKNKFPSMEEAMPVIYKDLDAIQTKLENHYRDMQDMEFTVQEGKLWFLQTRNGKRTGAAMVKIAMDLLRQGMIDEKTALERIEPNKLDELLHPVFDKEALKKAKVLVKGLPASPGAATGQIVFFAEDAADWYRAGKKIVLVRIETSPEDLAGMAAAEGILTARGGMTSHAAVVARGMGKCCVSGAGGVNIDYRKKTMEIDGKVFNEGDYISINGTTGEVYEGQISTQDAEVSGDFEALMTLTDKYATMGVRTNADTPHDASVARKFGAVGIGLCRTEHMFFEGEKIKAMREMILAENAEERKKALEKLLPFQKEDFKGIFKAMADCPVTVRLLDPPLHEFVPHDDKGQQELADAMGVNVDVVRKRVEALHENNPMLGHRGCRLGNTYPEITEMQTKAILGAALELKKEGVTTYPEIMVPLTGIIYEFLEQEKIIRATAEKLFAEAGDKIDYKVGTMIEIPRAALTADRIASAAEFFSFGTNDLTQMTFGYSRDDIASFLPIYLEKKILKFDPFQVLDQRGVGQLVRMAVNNGREVRPDLKCGICGEHGGEPSSVKFCHSVGLNYVSCSPFRVPIARVAAAQAAIENK
ncbi:pyruvate,orthophosphate dikinase [Parabacteroides sp. PF5-5]|uniref:pyruvate, phosphate dikinase n=1 Tax=unclassified Parabacteroides TaxID=2649774 RepID=UPI00247578D7|nr:MULTISPECIES: pyruvate, phosphate dikinase [unclassified Parabacteroides]MDH6304111.1 pyruvate,orthophosphate dikinase [Parabacteroides sp. PH5-39]MDH6315189.1 pyruvate,orthophosphate dikinase [Parabacteroides sp. PF5-13]MDH6318834.1 pyruvate,orthophosphate dikinase [Parabacteroides sp. PH5-13]MDH6322563.1 pyruvate,orthophosphate dikinase [Parabacteroides sp. PH5-8]MDH6326285.1 pyruvate,orthophosphate dikinase [Parabacteroides sp. PH5-41]